MIDSISTFLLVLLIDWNMWSIIGYLNVEIMESGYYVYSQYGLRLVDEVFKAKSNSNVSYTQYTFQRSPGWILCLINMYLAVVGS
jgi:hypothetical protein